MAVRTPERALQGSTRCGGIPGAASGCVRWSQQVRQLSGEVRAGAAEALDDSVRGECHVGVLACRDIRQQFEYRRVGFLDVVHQDQLEAFPLGGQEFGGVLEDLAGRRDDSGGVECLRHPQVQDVAVLGVQCGRSDPVGTVALLGQSHQVGGRPAGFDDPVKELAYFLTETTGFQSGTEIVRPRQLKARQGVSFQQFLDN
ncbi:hypothetical protein D9M72_486300 [compost metagenome]